MEIRQILENLIKDFSEAYLDGKSKQNVLCKNGQHKMKNKIFCNFWKDDILTALKGHDFQIHPLSCEMLANWLIRYSHALFETADRKKFEMCNTLHQYSPRPEFLGTLEKTSPCKDFKIFELIGQRVCERNLCSDNFNKIFQMLLEMEDVEILHEYLPLVLHNVDLQRHGELYDVRVRNIGNVISPGNDELVIIPKSDVIKFDTKNPKNLINVLIQKEEKISRFPVLTVKEVCENKIIFEKDIKAKHLKAKHLKSVDLIFRPSRVQIRYQQRALSLLAEENEMFKFFFPINVEKTEQKIALKKTNLKLVNEKIAENFEQLAAVKKIAAGLNPKVPYIIFGPPGTGKTTTIVEAILQLRLQQPKSRILVTAGSNSACNTIALRLCEYFESNDTLKEHLENSTVLPLLRIFSMSILRRGHIPKELREQSNIDWIKGLPAYPAIEDIHRYGIIIATLCTVGKLVCGNVSSENFFTHVFIDEAGASSEPETLVGIMGIKNKFDDNCCVILSGDHKQLGPVIKSDKANKFGLGKSMMQRLLESECYAVNSNNNQYDQNVQMRLRRNYRSHPEIVRLYNELYYDSQLIAMASKAAKNKEKKKWSILNNSDFPIAFHAVNGVMSKDGTTSTCNMLEVKTLISYITQLVNVDGVKENDVGVITPYRLQSERIKESLEIQNFKKIEVGSVENYQGREKEIIIASMVRSSYGLGFVKSPQRLNVLLSRPQSLLLILGNPKTLSNFKDMKFVIEWCKKKGNYFTEKNAKLKHSFNNKTEKVLAKPFKKLEKNLKKQKATNITANLENQQMTKTFNIKAVSMSSTSFSTSTVSIADSLSLNQSVLNMVESGTSQTTVKAKVKRKRNRKRSTKKTVTTTTTALTETETNNIAKPSVLVEPSKKMEKSTSQITFKPKVGRKRNRKRNNKKTAATTTTALTETETNNIAKPSVSVKPSKENHALNINQWWKKLRQSKKKTKLIKRTKMISKKLPSIQQETSFKPSVSCKVAVESKDIKANKENKDPNMKNVNKAKKNSNDIPLCGILVQRT